jgi:aryl-alcohol dehydrogenase-like predicted oxidoreductase
MSVQHVSTRERSAHTERAMEFAAIPGTALHVSRIRLGTWAIGGTSWGGTKEEESIATITAALGHGITLIDTAPAYGFGRSEEIVGKALAGGLRDDVVIATKADPGHRRQQFLGGADGGVPGS